VLVAGRTPDGRDDSAAYYTALVASLSSAQVRMHYAIYSVLRGEGIDGGRQLNNAEGRAHCNVYIPLTHFTPPGTDPAQANLEVSSALEALHRERLIGEEWATMLRPGLLRLPGATDPGLHVAPSAIGARLFLLAHGCRIDDPSALLIPDLELADFDPPVRRPQGAIIGTYGG
jgi:hypothetical protein